MERLLGLNGRSLARRGCFFVRAYSTHFTLVRDKLWLVAPALGGAVLRRLAYLGLGSHGIDFGCTSWIIARSRCRAHAREGVISQERVPQRPLAEYIIKGPKVRVLLSFGGICVVVEGLQCLLGQVVPRWVVGSAHLVGGLVMAPARGGGGMVEMLSCTSNQRDGVLESPVLRSGGRKTQRNWDGPVKRHVVVLHQQI